MFGKCAAKRCTRPAVSGGWVECESKPMAGMCVGTWRDGVAALWFQLIDCGKSGWVEGGVYDVDYSPSCCRVQNMSKAGRNGKEQRRRGGKMRQSVDFLRTTTTTSMSRHFCLGHPTVSQQHRKQSRCFLFFAFSFFFDQAFALPFALCPFASLYSSL